MKNNRRIVISVIYIILGIALTVVCAFSEIDEYWSGMGGALIVVGVVQLIRFGRYAKDTEYKEKVDTERGDERNRFISGRAWAWAGYLFVLAGALSSILFRVFGQELLSLAASGGVCFMLVAYWVSYLVLKRKY